MKSIIKNCFKTIFVLFASIALFLSCDIGLGEAIDLQAPELTVLSPEVLASVPQSFEVTGTASDNYGITSILVQIAETGQQYRYNGYEWQKYTGSEWVKYENARISGNSSEYNWSVMVTINSGKSAEDYTIVCQAFDEMGNEGKTSKDERCITLDIVQPTVSIIDPVVTTSYSSAYNKWQTYTLKDNNVLSSLINGDFTISGSQKEDTSLRELYVYLDEGTSEVVTSYNEEANILSVINPIYSAKVTGESLRNWETEVKMQQLPSSILTGKKLLRLITESHDNAGNVERKVQGWFIYYNEADIPWIDAKFGDASEITNTDKNAGPVQTQVYPNCTLQGQTYDDDGLAEVKIVRTSFDSVNGVWEDADAFVDINNLSSKDYPKYFAWSVTAISENKRFKVEITCKDKNGVEGEPIVRYMGITDTTPPTIKIESPKNGDTIISENITIKGTVVDDGTIKSLKMVRLQNANKEDMLYYFDGTYPGWTTEKTENQIPGAIPNKIFTIPLDGSDDPVGGYVTKTFEKTFNIFTDFGISATENINTQNFIFNAVDNNDASTIESFTLQGDTQAPELKIKEVNVYNSSGTKLNTNPYDLTTDEIPTLKPFNKTAGNVTDKLEIKGTWSDNSYSIWRDINKIGKIKIKVADKDYEIIPGTDGTWTTDQIAAKDVSTISVSASITDWGGNTTKATSSFYVDNNLPELVRISSETTDGSYKVGDKIFIVLEYNKKVTFTGTQGATLNLNNGGTATYDSSSNTNGSAKHRYVYEILSANTDTSKLTVSSIVTNDAEWKDIDNASISDATAIPSGMNLGDLRTIKIDKQAPKVDSISAITAGGYYVAGKEIFVQLTFNEDVYFKDASGNEVSSLSGVDLTFNTGKKSATVTKTSAKNLLFKYVIGAGETANPLKITAISLGSYNITDKAGNVLESPTISASNDISSKEIKILTSTPTTPVITVKEGDKTLTSGDLVYSPSGATITINWGATTGSVKKYSIDGGSSWADWGNKTSDTITRSGDYTITAYQENEAGTRSNEATYVRVKLDIGNILTSVTSTTPDGTYSVGDEVKIVLNFRKAVTVSADSKLELNITNTDSQKCYANIVATTEADRKEKTSLTYSYTIKANDSVNELQVVKLTQTSITDKDNNDISSYVPLPTSDGTKLQDNRTIKIDTGLPTISRIEWEKDSSGKILVDDEGNAQGLNIVFGTNNITKSSGNIIIEQDYDSYIPPAVLTRSQYNSYKSNTTIANAYEKKTNGANESGTADLSEKYVLKYSLNTINNSDLKAAFKTVGALKHTVSVKSPSVTITGTNSNIVNIPLTGTWKLPVKGAQYKITAPVGMVTNELRKANTTGKEETLTAPGVEKPVIRIEKKEIGFFSSTTDTNFTNLNNATVKIDCQTPNATICYTNGSKNYSTYSYQESDCSGNIKSNQGFPKKPSAPAISNSYTGSFNALTGTVTPTSGYKVFIRARATSDNGTTWSKDAYEVAYRTVVIFSGSPKYSFDHIWIRGGDATSGGVTTAGFPLSWINTELDKIKCMAYDSTTKNYVWVTWDISATMYVGFISGAIPETDAEKAKGPEVWCWASCSWVNTKEHTPIYPGESFTLSSSVQVNDSFAWQDKHYEGRDSNGQLLASGDLNTKLQAIIEKGYADGRAEKKAKKAPLMQEFTELKQSNKLKKISDTDIVRSGWGESEKIAIPTDNFRYTANTWLYVVIAAKGAGDDINCNFRKNQWGEDGMIKEGQHLEYPICKFQIGDALAKQFNNNKEVWIQNSGGTIKEIYAYNE